MQWIELERLVVILERLLVISLVAHQPCIPTENEESWVLHPQKTGSIARINDLLPLLQLPKYLRAHCVRLAVVRIQFENLVKVSQSRTRLTEFGVYCTPQFVVCDPLRIESDCFAQITARFGPLLSHNPQPSARVKGISVVRIKTYRLIEIRGRFIPLLAQCPSRTTTAKVCIVLGVEFDGFVVVRDSPLEIALLRPAKCSASEGH